MNASALPWTETEIVNLNCLAEIFGASLAEQMEMHAESKRREVEGWEFGRDQIDVARMYWGPGPLPCNGRIVGTIRRPDGRMGALIQINRRTWVQGNAGVITSLDQAAITDLYGD